MHAPASNGLDDAEQALPVGKHIKHRRHLAHVLGESTVKHQVAGNAKQLSQHDANYSCAVRHFDACKGFHRHHIGHVIHHAAEVVDAVGIGNKGVPGLAFGHLFGAAVVVADVGHRVDHDFAVQLQGKAEYTVHRGMVRSQVEEHEFTVFGCAGHTPLFGLEQQRFLLRVLLFLVETERFHLGGPGRVVFAQCVPFPGRGQQNAAQVWVPAETYSIHVPGFALIPVGVGPDARCRGHAAVRVRHCNLEPNLFAIRNTE